jgi:hypothetical protein
MREKSSPPVSTFRAAAARPRNEPINNIYPEYNKAVETETIRMRGNYKKIANFFTRSESLLIRNRLSRNLKKETGV